MLGVDAKLPTCHDPTAPVILFFLFDLGFTFRPLVCVCLQITNYCAGCAAAGLSPLRFDRLFTLHVHPSRTQLCQNTLRLVRYPMCKREAPSPSSPGVFALRLV